MANISSYQRIAIQEEDVEGLHDISRHVDLKQKALNECIPQANLQKFREDSEWDHSQHKRKYCHKRVPSQMHC